MAHLYSRGPLILVGCTIPVYQGGSQGYNRPAQPIEAYGGIFRGYGLYVLNGMGEWPSG